MLDLRNLRSPVIPRLLFCIGLTRPKPDLSLIACQQRVNRKGGHHHIGMLVLHVLVQLRVPSKPRRTTCHGTQNGLLRHNPHQLIKIRRSCRNGICLGRPLSPQVHEPDVLLQLGLAHELLAASLLLPVPVGNVFDPECVDKSTHKPHTLVGSSDVGVEIRPARKCLVAPLPRTCHCLALLHRGARVKHVDVFLQVALAAALGIAKRTTNMLPLHVRLQQKYRGKSHPMWFAVITFLLRTLVAPELELAVFPLDMSPQRTRRVEAALAAVVVADKGRLA